MIKEILDVVQTPDRPCCDGYKILETIGMGGVAVVKLVEKDGR